MIDLHKIALSISMAHEVSHQYILSSLSKNEDSVTRESILQQLVDHIDNCQVAILRLTKSLKDLIESHTNLDDCLLEKAQNLVQLIKSYKKALDKYNRKYHWLISNPDSILWKDPVWVQSGE